MKMHISKMQIYNINRHIEIVMEPQWAKFRIESNEEGTNLCPKNSLSPYLNAPPAIPSCLEVRGFQNSHRISRLWVQWDREMESFRDGWYLAPLDVYSSISRCLFHHLSMIQYSQRICVRHVSNTWRIHFFSCLIGHVEDTSWTSMSFLLTCVSVANSMSVYASKIKKYINQRRLTSH